MINDERKVIVFAVGVGGHASPGDWRCECVIT